MPHLPNPTREAAQSIRALEQQFAQMQRALGSLRDQTAGLHSAIRAPVPSGGNRYTKRMRTMPSALLSAAESGIGSLLGGAITGSGSFYTSSTQAMSSLLSALRRGQRLG